MKQPKLEPRIATLSETAQPGDPYRMVTWQVGSFSDAEKHYDVTLLVNDGQEEWRCNCKAFEFRKEYIPAKLGCPHIRFVREWLDAQENAEGVEGSCSDDTHTMLEQDYKDARRAK